MRNETQKFIHYLLRVFLIVALVLASSALRSQVDAATYFLSPTGSDSNDGRSSASPWKTFGFAIPQLLAGDTLVLRNGTYNSSNSGYPYVNCGSNAVNGTGTQPITIKAENERQAYLQSNGSSVPFAMRNCSWWIIEGIRAQSGDFSNPSGYPAGNVMYFGWVSNITVRRNLLSNNNRYVNASALLVEVGTNILIEENELYSFQRSGISGSWTGGTIRRNYVNSRNHADIPGGYISAPTDKGDVGIGLYPGVNVTIENNIVEGNGAGFAIQAAYGPATGNKYYGNISINNDYGVHLAARSENVGIDQMPRDTTIKDQVSINSSVVGMYPRGVKNAIINGCTLISAGSHGFAVDAPVSAPGDGDPTFFLSNCVAVNNGGVGFYVDTNKYKTWTLSATYAFNNNPNYSPSSSPAITGADTDDPKLGSCRVFIPASSPLKQAGIGANILYRYENGTLQDGSNGTAVKPLWDPATGEFPHGVIVPGVNDIAGASAFDVHKTLNVNTNACPFPAGYASGAAVTSSSASQTTSSVVSQTSPSAGPVGSWKFDEGSGSSASDASGNGNTGALFNGPIWITGIKGTALSFDGVDDYVNMGNSSSVNVTGRGITVQAWAKGSSPGNYKYIVSKTNGLYMGYGLYTGSSGTLRFYIGNGSGLITTPDVTSPWDNRWHHIAGTYDGSKLNLYIDGVARASVAATGNIADSSPRPLNIGRFSEGGFLFTGVIDDVQIYNRALSPTEIQQLYSAVPIVRPSSPINLIVTK